MRHTWAITVATGKRWAGICDGESAIEMGNDLSTHINHSLPILSSQLINYLVRNQTQLESLIDKVLKMLIAQ